jgi:uncharacterized protein YeeX (DUF496 family)
MRPVTRVNIVERLVYIHARHHLKTCPVEPVMKDYIEVMLENNRCLKRAIEPLHTWAMPESTRDFSKNTLDSMVNI